MQIPHAILSAGVFLLLLSAAFAAECKSSRSRSRNSTHPATKASQCATSPPQSRLQSSSERVFSRRRRFVLLPQGGALKFTVSLSKRLLAMYPRGFNLGLEAAVYYPAFTTRMDLLPKRFRATATTSAPKPAGPTKPLLVYIPGSELRYKAKPALKPSKWHRIDDIRPVHWLDSDKESLSNKTGESNKPWLKYGKYGNVKNHKFSTLSSSSNDARWWLRTKWPKRAKYPGLANTADAGAVPLEAELPLHRPVDFPDLEPYRDSGWKHFHGHRDRRQLFHGFEGLSTILGFDMKACILRTICESKRVLLPAGYSMLHDMLRVVFTVPTKVGMNDEYSRTVRSDYESCEAEFQAKCALSLLNMFLNPVAG